MLLVGAGRNFNATNSKPWLSPHGRLAQLRDDGHPELAGHAAWLLYEMLANKSQEKARARRTRAGARRDPPPTRPRARPRHRDDHDHDLALIATSLDQRNGSSDRAWTGLSCVAVVDVSSCHRWLGGFAR
jgi:hypothetical protein